MGKEKEMAARKGSPGFTRGGLAVSSNPVNAHPTGGGAQGPRRAKGNKKGTNYAEPIAWGIAGGLTVLAGGLIGGALASGGMDNRYSNKKR
jgi:hypothetical protein